MAWCSTSSRTRYGGRRSTASSAAGRTAPPAVCSVTRGSALPRRHSRLVGFENVAIGLQIHGYPRNDIKRRVAEVLDRLDILRYQRAYPQMLSAGEQQRVAIARAIVTKPPILLADEPTGNLDPSLSIEIAEIFNSIHSDGTTVMVATHDPTLPQELPHRTITLNNGYLVLDTAPEPLPDQDSQLNHELPFDTDVMKRPANTDAESNSLEKQSAEGDG